MAPADAIILVQNEETAGNRFDFYEDVEGESYHFPNGMKGLIVPGRPFIYYRGVRRKGNRRGPAEYFGNGIIGAVEPADIRNGSQSWRCDIEDYVPFPVPIPAILNGQYVETDIRPNLWGKVRRISRRTYSTILRLAGMKYRPETDDLTSIVSRFPSLASVTPAPIERGSELLLQRPILAGNVTPRFANGNVRRSRYSKVIGDRSEEIAKKYLESVLSDAERKTLRWLADEGKTPGWDFQYGIPTQFIAVEVKGTTGSHFLSIEFTDGEWTAAKLLRNRYKLLLVSECGSSIPRIEEIVDPYGKYEQGVLSAKPLTWRLERVSSA